MTSIPWVTLGVVAMGLVGCTPKGSQEDALRISVDSSGRYPVVRSAGVPSQWSAELVFSVGSASGGADEFARIRSVLLDRNGSLYVVDNGNREIRVFDSTGRFVRQLGRSGSGPGEYRDPYSIAWLGDTLALLDPGNARIGLFDRRGTWAGSFLLSRPITGNQFIRLYRPSPTAVWTIGHRTRESGLEAVFVRYSARGPGESLAVIRQASGPRAPVTCMRPDRGLAVFATPFGTSLLVVPTPSGLRAVALTSAYRIALLDGRGDTVRVIEREITPAGITDAEWDAGLQDWRRFRTQWPTATCDREGFVRPPFKPVLYFLFYDDRGRLWTEVVAQSGLHYEVFDTTGRLIGRLDGLPPSRGIDPGALGDRIAFVVQDSLGVPGVQVFRVRESP